MDTGHRQFVGQPVPHSLSVEHHADLWARQFASPFAQGTACRVSDTFGPRLNPFYFMKPKVPAAGASPANAAATSSDAPAGAAATATPSDKAQPAFRIGPRIENHPGVDVAVRAGTPVHALATGTVIFTGSDDGFGNMAVLRIKDTTQHDTALLLGHMERLDVFSGQTVAKGDVIGWVGSTGRSTGPHLHLQICPAGHVTSRGGFACGQPANPYENWVALEAIARLSCSEGPVGF
jgi:murein DD-endopeptidase MepM/ murein hydrolase activator NlpD